MKIFITNVEDQGEEEAILDGTCDCCFVYGWYNQYLVTFSLQMSDGTAYDIAHDGVVDYESDDEDGLFQDYTYTGPIHNVLKFVSDIKQIEFPDIEFFDNNDEYFAAFRPGATILPMRFYPRGDSVLGRENGIRDALNDFLLEIIKAYAGDGIDGINNYIEKKTAFARKGN